MKMLLIRVTIGCLTGLACCLLAPTHAAAQVPELVTTAYRVDDILVVANNYQFTGVQLPAAGGGGWIPGQAMNFGSGGGGRTGGGGGGVFSIPDQLLHNTTFRQGLGGGIGGGGGIGYAVGRGAGGFGVPELPEVTIDDLVNTLTELLEMNDADAWNRGGIQQLGSTLIVTSTADQHKLIKSHLQMIRETVSSASRSVSILVTWLQIDDEKYQMLGATTEGGLRLVDPEKLKAVAAEDGSHGSITCFDGQTVHLVSGEMKNQIRSATPVVGSVLNPAPNAFAARRDQLLKLVSSRQTTQDESTSTRGSSGIAYNPESESLNLGAMLQLTPLVVPNEGSVLLDVQSNVVLPMNQVPGTETIDFADSIKLDRMHIRSQQFRTSLKLPLGKPVIVGGSTVQVGSGSAIYVVLEVHAGK